MLLFVLWTEFRESCDNAMIGMFSSFAVPFSILDMAATSCSLIPLSSGGPCMSWLAAELDRVLNITEGVLRHIITVEEA